VGHKACPSARTENKSLNVSHLPLTLIRIALVSAKKGHGVFIFYILRTIYDSDNISLRANGLTDTHSLGDVIEVALRRIPIAPDLNPNFVICHRTPPATYAGVYQ
jgi:hypothetical protein